MAYKIDGLLPCPFCGEDGMMQHKHYKRQYMGMRSTFTGFLNTEPLTMYWAGCYANSPDKCFSPKAYSHSKDEAIKIWNKRFNP